MENRKSNQGRHVELNPVVNDESNPVGNCESNQVRQGDLNQVQIYGHHRNYNIDDGANVRYLTRLWAGS